MIIRRALYTLRYLLPAQRAHLVARLALAMECGVLTFEEAFESYRREVPWWVLMDSAEARPFVRARAPKELAIAARRRSEDT